MNLDQSASALQEIVLTLVVIAVAVAALEGFLYLVLVRWVKARLAIHLMLIAPAFVGLLLLILYPLLWELNVSFTNMSLRRFCAPDFPTAGLLTECKGESMFVGAENYIKVFTTPVLQQAGFFQVLWQTVLWTVLNVTMHVAGGLGLALLLHRQMRGKGIYRALIVLPWAVPQIVALAVWRTELHGEFGMVNQLLGLVGVTGPSWLTDPTWNFAAMVMVNVWLGIPFMMVILLGGLQSIPGDLYEAAEIDGASSRQSFRHITLPMIAPVLTPAIILGVVWTFNNFNVPFVLNQNELETSDTLVTGLFRAAFQYNRYGFAGAYAFPIFILAVQLDLTGTYRGLVIAYSVTSVPFSIWILKGYYDTVPIELEEAARIDGASQLGAFWRILLPLSAPALAIVFLFNFLAAWNEFVLARVLIGSTTELFTWPLGILRFQAQFQTQWGDLAAASILVSIPIVALFLYSSKWLISGVTLGGVKG